ncbi:MAG: hypothetical protein ACI4E4_02615 [Acetatifactor sp.]
MTEVRCGRRQRSTPILMVLLSLPDGRIEGGELERVLAMYRDN